MATQTASPGASSFELENVGESTANGRVEPNETQSLPPVDRGRDAYFVLAAAFAVEALVWGFPYSFGVLSSYYRSHAPISNDPSGLSAVGTTCTGLMFMSGPIITAILQQGPRYRTWSPTVGLVFIALGIALSSIATEVWHLILTQGILYAAGGGLLALPLLLYMDEWFFRKKSVAYGVMWAGTGVGGVATPLIMEWGLAKYGVKTFLRGWAVTLLVCIGPLLIFVRPRVPWSGNGRGRLRNYAAGFGFVKLRLFWVLQLAMLIQSLGYFIPSLYLPEYAQTVGLSIIQSSAIVSGLNLAAVPGIIAVSLLCDRMNVASVIGLTSIGSALAIFLFWGLSSASTSLPLLVTFAIFYGFFAGGFTAIPAAMAKEVMNVAPEGSMDLGSLFSMIFVARGIGNIVSGPLSKALIRGQTSTIGVVAYKSHYSPLVIFSGVSAVLTMVPWVTRQFLLVW